MERAKLPAAIARRLGECALIEDLLGRSSAQVFSTGEYFLKVGERDSLRRAALMQEYFARHRLSAPLYEYIQQGERDFLLMGAVPGRDATKWLNQPKWLCAQLAEAMRLLHSIPANDCPITDVNEQALRLYEKEKGHAFEGDAGILRKDALLHGDCCLPNAMFDEKGFCGFIDLGEGGLGDRHFDLYWARWSLAYNLKTEKYGDYLLDAYGREAIDPERLEICARLSALS